MPRMRTTLGAGVRIRLQRRCTEREQASSLNRHFAGAAAAETRSVVCALSLPYCGCVASTRLDGRMDAISHERQLGSDEHARSHATTPKLPLLGITHPIEIYLTSCATLRQCAFRSPSWF